MFIIRIVVLTSIPFTEVTPKMILTQVLVKLVIVKITLITKFTTRVSLVGFVIRVTNSAVSCQIRTRVGFQFKAELLQIFYTEITIELFMFPLHVITETAK